MKSSEEYALCGASGICRAPRRERALTSRAGAQEGRHLRFPPSCESGLSLARVWRRLPTCDRCEIGHTAVGLPLRVFYHLFAAHRQCTATHVIKSTQARHTRVAQLFGMLYRTAPTRYRRLIDLSSQVLSIITRSRIAQHGHVAPAETRPICVAVMYLTLRTGCERHGRENPLPLPFSKRSHIGNLRRIRKQGKGRRFKEEGKPQVSLPFCPPPWVRRHPRRGARHVPAVRRRRIPPAEVQRKTLRPERANPPAAVRVPRWVGAEKELPGKGEPANGSSRAPAFRCRKGAARKGRTR